VDYSVTGGSATGDGVDFTLTAGTATITAGNLSASIPISITNDVLDEASETIQLSLSNPVNASLGANALHTYTITDNDSPPSVQFTVSTSSSSEGNTPANLALQLSAASALDVTVDYAVTGGTAAGGGEDYTLSAGSATILAGETSTTIPAVITNDLLDVSLIRSMPAWVRASFTPTPLSITTCHPRFNLLMQLPAAMRGFRPPFCSSNCQRLRDWMCR
jgi:hypothetical protein